MESPGSAQAKYTTLARILETGSPIAVLLGWQPVVFHREVAHDSDSFAFWALGGSIPIGGINWDRHVRLNVVQANQCVQWIHTPD